MHDKERIEKKRSGHRHSSPPVWQPDEQKRTKHRVNSVCFQREGAVPLAERPPRIRLGVLVGAEEWGWLFATHSNPQASQDPAPAMIFCACEPPYVVAAGCALTRVQRRLNTAKRPHRSRAGHVINTNTATALAGLFGYTSLMLRSGCW